MTSSTPPAPTDVGIRPGRGDDAALLAWAEVDGVTRVQLNAVTEARTLYERMGFGPPSERLMELRLSDRSRRAAG